MILVTAVMKIKSENRENYLAEVERLVIAANQEAGALYLSLIHI